MAPRPEATTRPADRLARLVGGVAAVGLAVLAAGCAAPDAPTDALSPAAPAVEVVASSQGRVTLSVVVKRAGAVEATLVTATCGDTERLLWGITDPAAGAVRFSRLAPRECTLTVYAGSEYSSAPQRTGDGEPPTAGGMLVDSFTLPVAVEGTTLQQSALGPEGYEIETTLSSGD